jgi:hypothetical protein
MISDITGSNSEKANPKIETKMNSEISKSNP